MPRKSIREQLADLEQQLLSRERWVDAKLIVLSHTGEELFSVGGCWDRVKGKYIDRPCVGRVFRLVESQEELGRAIGKYLAQRLAGDDERVACLMAIGNRGGGKTLGLGGVLVVAIALALAGSFQMGVSITAKQNRELKAAIAMVAPPSWIAQECDDQRDPYTEFVTGSRILWHTSRNAKAMRQALLPFEHVLINEGQDQDEEVYVNGLGAVRKGGLLSIATNPPQDDLGDWTAILYSGLAGGSTDGTAHILDAAKNKSRGISHPTLMKIGRLLRLVNPAAADADAEGIIKLSGNVGYPGFTKLPRVEDGGFWKSGHIGIPHELGSGAWVDITREVTAEDVGGSDGFDWIGGGDFQTEPGSCAPVGKLYRLPTGQRLLYIRRFVATRGTERDLTAALNASGYYPGTVDWDGRPAASLMLVGDATGARQNAEHRKRDPYSFKQLRDDGWTVLPPDYYGPKRTPWNPLITDSRKQMKALFTSGLILFHPDCEQGVEGFPSLIDSFLRVKVTPVGKFEKKGHFTHGPDGVRYLAWRYMPRWIEVPTTGLDNEAFDALSSLRLFTSG